MKKDILLVEDDALLIDIFTTKFKEEGYDLRVAEDGRKALEEVRAKKPDLIMLDFVLPQITGREVLETIKKDPNLKDIKVIILSNLGQKLEVEEGLKMGADKYLIKANYTPSQVVEEVKKIFEGESIF